MLFRSISHPHKQDASIQIDKNSIQLEEFLSLPRKNSIRTNYLYLYYTWRVLIIVDKAKSSGIRRELLRFISVCWQRSRDFSRILSLTLERYL